MKNIFFVLFISYLFFSSCVSTYQLAIDVQTPAPIALPAEIKNLLVVNNSAKQPNDKGITLTFDGKTIPDYQLNFDSVSWITIESLSTHMDDARFFNEISFYDQFIRTDNNWLTIIPLSESFKNEIFESEGFDGIISIDEILFQGEQDVKNNMQYFSHFYVDSQIKSKLSCSIYLYDRKEPFTSFSIIDSLYFKDSVYEDSITLSKKLPELMIEELALRMGERIAQYIIPSWIKKDRIIYAGQNSRMQEALSFLRNQKWDEAKKIWMNEYEKKNQPKEKGKLANNIAVVNELQDKLDVALHWAVISQQSFKESDVRKESFESNQIDTYVEDLTKRIDDNLLLNKQLEN